MTDICVLLNLAKNLKCNSTDRGNIFLCKSQTLLFFTIIYKLIIHAGNLEMFLFFLSSRQVYEIHRYCSCFARYKREEKVNKTIFLREICFVRLLIINELIFLEVHGSTRFRPKRPSLICNVRSAAVLYIVPSVLSYRRNHVNSLAS